MKKLTQAAFQRAMAFVREQGRDLDRSLLHILLLKVVLPLVWTRPSWRQRAAA